MFSLKNLSVLLLSLAATTLSSPNTKLAVGPFKILVETPNHETFAPLYLQPSGKATSAFATAALFAVNDAGQLLGSSDFPIVANPIATPPGAVQVLLTQPKDVGPDDITTTWSVLKDGHLSWDNESFPDGTATYTYQLDGTEDVFAIVGEGITTQVGTVARLLTVATGDIPV